MKNIQRNIFNYPRTFLTLNFQYFVYSNKLLLIMNYLILFQMELQISYFNLEYFH